MNGAEDGARGEGFESGEYQPTHDDVTQANSTSVGHTVSRGEQLKAAATISESLSRLLAELSASTDTPESTSTSENGLRGDLAAITGSGVARNELDTLTELVEALVEKPSDLLLMMKLAEQSAQLASVVGSYRRIVQLLHGSPA